MDDKVRQPVKRVCFLVSRTSKLALLFDKRIRRICRSVELTTLTRAPLWLEGSDGKILEPLRRRQWWQSSANEPTGC